MKTYQSDFQGWNGYYLENDWVRLVAVPDIGGRIMAYNLGPYPYFYVERKFVGQLFSPEAHQGDGSLAAWKNYGGDKTWPAPQGWDNDQQWHGPPDPVLDTGRYTVDVFEHDDHHATIQMTSPPDNRTGVQITRRFTLWQDSSRVDVKLSFANVKDEAIRWSIWDVVQLRAEQEHADGSLAINDTCVITTPVNPNSRFDKGFNVMFGAEDNPQWQVQDGLLQAQYQWEIGKIGLDSQAGWIAFTNQAEGYAFAEHFQVVPDGDYPDEGATVEIWTVGAGQVDNLNFADSDIYHMETEVLSPFHTIQPGTSVSFDMVWGVCRCDGIVKDTTTAGTVTQALRAVRQGNDYALLMGRYGVFDKGTLKAVCHDAENTELGSYDMMTVSPMGTVIVDMLVPIIAETHTIELRVMTADGNQRALCCAVLE